MLYWPALSTLHYTGSSPLPTDMNIRIPCRPRDTSFVQHRTCIIGWQANMRPGRLVPQRNTIYIYIFFMIWGWICHRSKKAWLQSEYNWQAQGHACMQKLRLLLKIAKTRSKEISMLLYMSKSTLKAPVQHLHEYRNHTKQGVRDKRGTPWAVTTPPSRGYRQS